VIRRVGTPKREGQFWAGHKKTFKRAKLPWSHIYTCYVQGLIKKLCGPQDEYNSTVVLKEVEV
jgi:hypothetical protein